MTLNSHANGLSGWPGSARNSIMMMQALVPFDAGRYVF